jgi:hypothetical protein
MYYAMHINIKSINKKAPLKWGSYWMELGILGLSGERFSYYLF